MSSPRGTTRQYWVAIRSMIIFTVVLGLAYPLVITGIGLLAPSQANGSQLTVDGKVVGSALIGQSFTDKKGNALAEWFQSRPSAAGTGYDAGASSGSNQGTESPSLITAIKQRKAAIAASDHVQPRIHSARRADGVRLWPRPRHQPGVRPAADQPGRGSTSPAGG